MNSNTLSMWLLVLGVLITQILGVASSPCKQDDTPGTCCEADVCPDGYFHDIVGCDVTFTSATTLQATLKEPDSEAVTESSNFTENFEGDENVTSTIQVATNSTTENTTQEVVNISSTTSVPEVSTSTSSLVFCRRCPDNCITCNFRTECLKCQENFEKKDGGCMAKSVVPLGAIIGGAIGGAVVLIVVIVVAVVCCKRRRSSGNEVLELEMDKMVTLPKSKRQRDDYTDTPAPTPQASNGSPTYENMGFKPDDLAKQIPRKQDSVLRYARDPTIKRNTTEPEDVSDSEEIYANQASIELHQISQLGEAPPPPIGVQPTVKKRKKEEEVQQPAEEEQEVYENQEEVIKKRSQSERKQNDEQHEEVYYNETTYENFGFPSQNSK